MSSQLNRTIPVTYESTPEQTLISLEGDIASACLYHPPDLKGILQLCAIDVAPNNRGQGLGSKVFDAVVDFGLENDFEYLDTLAANERVISLFGNRFDDDDLTFKNENYGGRIQMSQPTNAKQAISHLRLCRDIEQNTSPSAMLRACLNITARLK